MTRRARRPPKRLATRSAAPPVVRAAPRPRPPVVDELAARRVGGPVQRARLEDSVIGLVNDIRRRRGLPELVADERLRASARRHSESMAALGFFAHEDPDGGTPETRMRAAGHARPGAENIAAGQRSAPEVVHAWMNSSGHRANIENPAFRSLGVGIRFGPRGHWWTQNFGY